MAEEDLRIDHVILAVKDLEAAAKRLQEEHRLLAGGGGVHPRGTKNMWVRFASGQYLELLVADDPEKVRSSSPRAEELLARVDKGDFLAAWAVGTQDIDAVATRLGIEPTSGSIKLTSGGTGSWRSVSSRTGDLPFFVQYDPPSKEQIESRKALLKAREKQEQDLGMVKPLSFSWIEVGVDEDKLRDWLGGADLPIRYDGTGQSLTAVGIATPDGEIVIR